MTQTEQQATDSTSAPAPPDKPPLIVWRPLTTRTPPVQAPAPTSLAAPRSGATPTRTAIASPTATLPAGTRMFKPAGSPPMVERGTREVISVPQQIVDVFPPPGAPQRPLASGQTIALGLLALLSAGVTLITIMTSRELDLGQALTGLTTLVASAFTVLSYFRERSEYRQKSLKREQVHRQHVDTLRADLAELCERQREALLVAHPPLDECLQRVERGHERLWERAADDPDYLEVRLGLGSRPPSFQINRAALPRPNSLEPDPLIEELHVLVGSYAAVDEVPITVHLAKAGITGVIGPREQVRRAARGMLLQLATHHPPDDLKIVLTFPESEMESWSWARWLPHVWNDQRERRFIAADAKTTRRLLMEIGDDLRQKRAAAGRNATRPMGPYIVFVFADPQFWRTPEALSIEPLRKLLLTDGPALGAYSLFLAENRQMLPNECDTVIDLNDDQARLRVFGAMPSETPFVPDLPDVALADRLARALAPVRLRGNAAIDTFPAELALLDMLGARRVEDLQVAKRWQSSLPYDSLAVTIGVGAGDMPRTVDIHAQGHGPHALIVGAPDSGKSELLQTLISALAVQFHPHDLAFVLFDFKDSDFAHVFRELPHQIGIATTLSDDLGARLIAALQRSIQQRQALFDRAGVSTIDAYQRQRRLHAAVEPLPHVVIVIDEFAELARRRLSLLRDLIALTTSNEHLGLHLLMATSQPNTNVVDHMLSIARLRICLRTESSEDSRRVLGYPDAISLHTPGRGYMQVVGQNDLFDMFQTALSTAPYTPQAHGSADTIVEVMLDGPISRAAPVQNPNGQSQVEALVAHIRAVAEAEHIQRPRAAWFPRTSRPKFLADVRQQTPGGWDGTGWRPSSHWLAPIAGMSGADAAPLRLDLTAPGHMAIFGAAGSGKTTLLQTVLLGLALDHSPRELRCFLLDCDQHALHALDQLPHIVQMATSGEPERLRDFIRALAAELNMRKRTLVQAGLPSMRDYRAQKPETPAVVVVVDNYAALRQHVPPQLVQMLSFIVREGAMLDTYLILTSGAHGDVPSDMRTNMRLFIDMEVVRPEADGLEINEHGEIAPMVNPRWRGFAQQRALTEFVPVLPIAGATDVERAAALATFSSGMRAAR